VSDTTTEQSPEVDDPGTLDTQRARDALKRERARRRELEPLAAENAELRRQLGLARAGVDPNSVLGQVVAAAAASDGLSDPDQIQDLARALSIELRNGGRARLEE
jgi:hypothetical protein